METTENSDLLKFSEFFMETGPPSSELRAGLIIPIELVES